MVTPVITYREASRQLLAHARAELDAGDLRQASEKAWVAAAQIVKAVAQIRGWDHYYHRGLYVTVDRLTDEVGDPRRSTPYSPTLTICTQTSTENTFQAVRIARYLSHTEEFIAKIEAILDAPTP